MWQSVGKRQRSRIRLEQDPISAEIFIVNSDSVASLVRIDSNDNAFLRPKLGQRILTEHSVARAKDRKILAFLIKFLLHLLTIARAKIRRVSRFEIREV